MSTEITYMLDTCICVDYLRAKNEKLLRRVRECSHDVSISAIVAAELFHGAYHSKRVEENLRDTVELISNFDVVPFDEPEAKAYGQILDSLQRKGQVIGSNDIMIAATALIRNAVLVTNNTHEFSRIDGLKLDDWTL